MVVADFGLAKIVPRHEPLVKSSKKEEEDYSQDFNSFTSLRRKRFSRRKRQTVVGNPYWMAPEMITKGEYDEKVDVFSYGIIVCEVCSLQYTFTKRMRQRLQRTYPQQTLKPKLFPPTYKNVYATFCKRSWYFKARQNSEFVSHFLGPIDISL